MISTLEGRIFQSSLVPVREELRSLEGKVNSDEARRLVRGARTMIAQVRALQVSAHEQAEHGIEATTYAAFLRSALAAIDEWLLVAPEVRQAVMQVAEPFPERKKGIELVEEGAQLGQKVRDELASILKLAETKGPPLDPERVRGTGQYESVDSIIARLQAGEDV